MSRVTRHIRFDQVEVFLIYLIFTALLYSANSLLVTQIAVSEYVEVLKIAVVALLGINIFFSLKLHRLKLYHPYIIFLGMFTLFILSRILLDVFLPYVFFNVTSFLTSYWWELDVLVTLLQNIILSLLGLQLGVALALVKFRNGLEQKNELETNRNWVRLGLFFFYLGLPFLMYQYIQMSSEIMAKGYLAFHKGEIEYSNNIITTFFSRFSWVGFFIFLAGMPSKKQLFFNLILFMVMVLTPKLLQGMRGPVMCILMCLFWYIYYIYNYRLKIRYLILIVVGMIFLNNFISFLRFGEEYYLEDKLLVKFLYRQGVSMQVLGYCVEYEDEMSDYDVGDMFANLRVFGGEVKNRFAKTKEEITPYVVKDKYGYLGYRITHIVNPEMFREGYSTGGSYLAELYLVGKERAQFLGSLLIGFFTIYALEKGRRSRAGIIFLLFFLPSWFYIPRDSIFNFISLNISNAIFIVISIVIMEKLLSTIRSRNSFKE